MDYLFAIALITAFEKMAREFTINAITQFPITGPGSAFFIFLMLMFTVIICVFVFGLLISLLKSIPRYIKSASRHQ